MCEHKFGFRRREGAINEFYCPVCRAIFYSKDVTFKEGKPWFSKIEKDGVK